MILNTEQINSVLLLLGIVEQMTRRDFIDAHVTPHGAWQGASVGTVVSIWLCHILAQRDHRLVAVRDWVAQRTVTLNTPERRLIGRLLTPLKLAPDLMRLKLSACRCRQINRFS